MRHFARIKNGSIMYPFDLSELHSEGVIVNKRSHPDTLSKYDVFDVHISPEPRAPIGYEMTQDSVPVQQGGFWVLGYTLTPLPLQDARAQAIGAMQAWAEDFTGQFISKYSTAEQLSFSRQEAMARAYLDDTATDAQVRSLTIQARTKGVTPRERATVIVAKAALFGDISDYTAGLRSRLEDQIAEAAVEDLQGILDAAAAEATQTAAGLLSAG